MKRYLVPLVALALFAGVGSAAAAAHTKHHPTRHELRGPRGRRGPRGPAGPPGAVSPTDLAYGYATVTVHNGTSIAITARCPGDGEVSISGGVYDTSESNNDYLDNSVESSYASDDSGAPLQPSTAWTVQFNENDPRPATDQVTVFVVCIP